MERLATLRDSLRTSCQSAVSILQQPSLAENRPCRLSFERSLKEPICDAPAHVSPDLLRSRRRDDGGRGTAAARDRYAGAGPAPDGVQDDRRRRTATRLLRPRGRRRRPGDRAQGHRHGRQGAGARRRAFAVRLFHPEFRRAVRKQWRGQPDRRNDQDHRAQPGRRLGDHARRRVRLDPDRRLAGTGCAARKEGGGEARERMGSRSSGSASALRPSAPPAG